MTGRSILLLPLLLLLCSCGESESEKLARETRERNAIADQLWERDRKQLQELRKNLKQGNGITMTDFVGSPPATPTPQQETAPTSPKESN